MLVANQIGIINFSFFAFKLWILPCTSSLCWLLCCLWRIPVDLQCAALYKNRRKPWMSLNHKLDGFGLITFTSCSNLNWSINLGAFKYAQSWSIFKLDHFFRASHFIASLNVNLHSEIDSLGLMEAQYIELYCWFLIGLVQILWLSHISIIKAPISFDWTFLI